MPNNKKASPFGDAHKSPSIRFDFDPKMLRYRGCLLLKSIQSSVAYCLTANDYEKSKRYEETSTCFYELR